MENQIIVTNHKGEEIKNPKDRRDWLWGEILAVMDTYADLTEKPRIDRNDFVKNPTRTFFEYHSKWFSRFACSVPLKVNKILEDELTRCIPAMEDLYYSEEPLSGLYIMSYYCSTTKNQAFSVNKKIKNQ